MSRSADEIRGDTWDLQPGQRGEPKQAETVGTTGRVGNGRGKTMADTQISLQEQTRPKLGRSSPLGLRGLRQSPSGLVLLAGQRCFGRSGIGHQHHRAACAGFSLHEGEDARCLYLICSGYLKLTAGRPEDRHMIVRVAGPGSMLGLYAVLSHGVYEVSAESLTPAQLRPVERERFLSFLRNHKEAQLRAVQCICQEYRFALQDACRIALAETVAARLARLLHGTGASDRRTH